MKREKDLQQVKRTKKIVKMGKPLQGASCSSKPMAVLRGVEGLLGEVHRAYVP